MIKAQSNEGCCVVYQFYHSLWRNVETLDFGVTRQADSLYQILFCGRKYSMVHYMRWIHTVHVYVHCSRILMNVVESLLFIQNCGCTKPTIPGKFTNFSNANVFNNSPMTVTSPGQRKSKSKDWRIQTDRPCIKKIIQCQTLGAFVKEKQVVFGVVVDFLGSSVAKWFSAGWWQLLPGLASSGTSMLYG